MGITGNHEAPVVVKGCQHAGLAQVWWDYGPGEAPCLVYRGLPMAGAMGLAQKVVIVTCKSCLDHVNEIIKEVSRTNSQ